MKRFFLVNVIMVAFCLCSMLFAQVGETAVANQDAYLIQAIDGALAKAKNALLTVLPENKTIVVLPFPSQKPGTSNSGSNDYFIAKLTNILTQDGYKVAVAKEDKVFEELVKQIVWAANKNFTPEEAAIIKKLGQMKNAQVLLYGSIDNRTFGNYLNADITLYAIDVDSATHLWGETFKGSTFLGKDINGVVNMDSDYMSLFTGLFQEAGTELKQALTTDKLIKVHTIAMLPISGDIDQYVTAKAREMFTRQFDLKTIESNIPTLEQACKQFGAPEKKLADSIFWGSIRDLSTTDLPEEIDKKAWTKTIPQRKRVEVELNISEASTGATIWTRTYSKEIVVRNSAPIPMPKPKLPWWENKAIITALAVIIGLCILVVIIRGILIATRPR